MRPFLFNDHFFPCKVGDREGFLAWRNYLILGLPIRAVCKHGWMVPHIEHILWVSQLEFQRFWTCPNGCRMPELEDETSGLISRACKGLDCLPLLYRVC